MWELITSLTSRLAFVNLLTHKLFDKLLHIFRDFYIVIIFTDNKTC